MNNPQTIADQGFQLFNNNDSSTNQQKTLEKQAIALKMLGKNDIALVAGRKKFYWGSLADGFRKCRIEGDYEGGEYEWVPFGPRISIEKIKNSDGLFFRPNRVGHLAKTWEGSDLFFSEDDKRSLEEQRQRADWLESLGIPLVLRVCSGSKSLHIYAKTSDTVTDVNKWRRIERKLLIVADSDLSIETPERLMRLPGGMRQEDGKWVEQSIEVIKEYDKLPTSEDLEAILDATGLFPYGLSDQQFSDYKRWRKTQKGENPLLKFPEPIKPPRRKFIDSLSSGKGSLVDCVYQANDRLGSDAFTSSVNNLGSFQNGKARCECPFHQSKSGNSAFISQHNGAYLFYCRMCTPRAIDGLFFSYCLDNSVEPDNRNYPKGKAWVEYAKVYCEKAGVSIPEREWKKTESPNQKDDFDIDKWKQEKALTVKKLKTFTPDLTVKKRISEYSPNELKNILLENGVKLSGDGVLDGIILNVKAPTGAGKTQFFIEVLRVFYQYTGCALLGYRNGLLLQTCERSNYSIIHINDNKDEFNDLRDSMRFGSCVDSILKVNTEWWEDKIIILDEVVSVLNHLLFSDTLKNKRAEVIDRFIHALRVARGVICLDGHNADFIASFFKGLTDKPVINLLNDYAIARPDIKFLEGTIKNQKLKKNDKSPFLKHIKDTIPHNPIAVLGDSKIFLKSLTEILESLGHKCLLITSETKRLKAVKDFIKDPDKSIQENRYDAVLFSPSAESGLSVDIKGYFKALYAFFFGVLGTDAQQQMIIRIRDIECPRYVWLRSHSIVTDSTFERQYDNRALLVSLLTSEVNALSLEYKADILATVTEKSQSFPIQLEELAENFRVIAKHEKINFRESFCNAVVENGYPLERVTLKTDKESNQEQKAKTKAIKERESLEIFNASDKYLYDIAPMLGENATDADRRAFDKAKILTDLPNLEFEDLWSPDFVKFLHFDRDNALVHRRLYVLANNLELAQKLSDRRYQSYIQKDKLCPWEMKPEYLQARAIAQSGILELITSPAQLLTADHPMVKEITQKCKKAAIYKPLGRLPGKDAMKFISHLLGRLGYTLKEQNYKTPDGKKARAYVLDYDDKVKTQPYFDVIDRLLTARFERAVLAPKASTIPKNEPKIDQIDFEHLDPPQTHAGYASEAVPDHLNKIKKNDDHLEPIQPPLTTAQSTTANNDVPDVGDLVICDEFPEHHILEIVGLHHGDKEWVRIRGDWWPAGETELSHISHLKKVERAIA